MNAIINCEKTERVTLDIFSGLSRHMDLLWAPVYGEPAWKYRQS
jgi:hypothetical protein